MDAEQVELVRGSFEMVKPITVQAADLFYNRLFEIAPETKPLFVHDMAEQGRKLMATLAIVVASLDRLETILPTVKQLTIDHVKWGVVPSHYQLVGSALLWALEQGLGPAFTPGVKEGWVEAYATVSGIMIQEAYPEYASSRPAQS